MRRGSIWLAGLIPMLTLAACGSGSGTTSAVSHHGQTYRDSAGWVIMVPPGWHAVRFNDSKDGITSAGAQVSNVQLPRPSLVPGFPIQVNGDVLPVRGVGLIIATDTEPKLPHYGRLAVPPLPAPDDPNGWKYWNAGSASAGVPYIETLWFRINGTTFIASAKIGPKGNDADLKTLAQIIHSLRLQPAAS
jgi:hypothetical protein